jgi:hypothetical protein
VQCEQPMAEGAEPEAKGKAEPKPEGEAKPNPEAADAALMAISSCRMRRMCVSMACSGRER